MTEITVPFIVNYLLERYIAQSNSKTQIDVDAFREWASMYMDTQRPSTIRSIAGNYVVKLVNGDEVSLAPPFEEGGMQHGGRAIPVTGHETAREILKAGGSLGKT